jgi:cold shock protein
VIPKDRGRISGPLLGYYTDDGRLIYAGRVGTGMPVKVLADVRRRLEPLSRRSSPLSATKGFGFIQPDAGGADVFVHISAVERAGMRDLNEGQKIVYEVVADRRTGKSSADNLKPA